MAPPMLFSMLLIAAARGSAAAEAPAPNERCSKLRKAAAEPASPWALAAEARRPTR